MKKFHILLVAVIGLLPLFSQAARMNSQEAYHQFVRNIAVIEYCKFHPQYDSILSLGKQWEIMYEDELTNARKIEIEKRGVDETQEMEIKAIDTFLQDTKKIFGTRDSELCVATQEAFLVLLRDVADHSSELKNIALYKVKLGQSIDTVKKLNPFLVCEKQKSTCFFIRHMNYPGKTVYNPSIGGHEVQDLLIDFYNGKVNSVLLTLKLSAKDQILSALKDKYGNDFETGFSGESFRWHGESGYLTLIKNDKTKRIELLLQYSLDENYELRKSDLYKKL